MRVAEFNGCGNFLVGARDSGHLPIFARPLTEDAEKVIKANLDVKTSTGEMKIKQVPRVDLVCVCPPTEGLAETLKKMSPRIVMFEITKATSKFLKEMEDLEYDKHDDEYSGLDMGLPLQQKKVFALLSRKGAKAISKYFPFPDPPGGNPTIKDFLSVAQEDLVSSEKGAKTVGPDDVLNAFPTSYGSNYQILFEENGIKRKFSVDEAALISGFPKGYQFPIQTKKAYSLIGQSTWPVAVRIILDTLREWIL